ncbi:MULTISPECIES: HIT family protein [Acinetobacter]|uniref:HIT family protein n=1 Tax=Acinetobacter piscicola TaxID=2006115 RepID=A0A4Q4GRA0_9GAMM|nr:MULTISPECIES: HIT family protein [Acinetobacter]MDM1759072.1 HIT family protein [Acinetobacter sp. 256-1]MDM1762418.1 HIT family protein [Acinetobacter sp. 251-1]QOW44470.1 HIT family protein [Acinetobacter piscicola]RYL21243.1 HIT family protein [Acinetobacter piscicola]
MTDLNCPYCNFDEYDIIAKNEFGAILPEPNPLSKGHSVIVPLRHITSFFDVSEKERKSLSSLLELARNELKIRHQPAGFHIAFNDGDVFADEHTEHFHIHIIPRYQDQVLVLDQRWGVTSKQ